MDESENKIRQSDGHKRRRISHGRHKYSVPQSTASQDRRGAGSQPQQQQINGNSSEITPTNRSLEVTLSKCENDDDLQLSAVSPEIEHTDDSNCGGGTPSRISEKFRTKFVKDRYVHRTSSETDDATAGTSGDQNCAKSKCCCCTNWFRKRNVKSPEEFDLEKELYPEDDPFRKRCLRAFLTVAYILLALVAAVVTYSMVQDLITSMRNPVRSIHYKKVEHYDAPGIAVYPGGAKFLACGHYYNNVVTSKGYTNTCSSEPKGSICLLYKLTVRTSDLDLVSRNCTFTPLKYVDPHYPTVQREVVVIRGPTSFVEREAVFLHFSLNDDTRDFFTVSYFVFPDYDVFNNSDRARKVEMMLDYHKYVPTFALSAGLRMWIKLIMSENFNMSDTKHTDFKVEYSVVKHWDRRPEAEHKDHVFFIFFEWKNDIIETSRLLYTTTPWSIGAGLCGVFLTLHRGYQLAQTSYNRFKKEKQKRSIRRRTLRELTRQRETATVQT